MPALNTLSLYFRSFCFNIFFFYMLFHISLCYRFKKPDLVKENVIRWVYIINRGMELILGLHYIIKGEKLKTPAIYASRHESTWETVLFFIIFKSCPIILKKELTQIPMFGGFLRDVGMISVDRQRGASAIKGMIRATRAAISSSWDVAIFPEGTRKKPGEFTEINTSGLYAIYHACNVPVVPMMLNSGTFWGRRSFVKYPGTITVSFLEPIMPGLEKDKFHQIFNELMAKQVLG